MLSRTLPFGLAGVFLVLAASPSDAGLFSWTNPAGGRWDDPVNWGASSYPRFFWDFARFQLPEDLAVDATDAARIQGVGGLLVDRGTVRLRTHSGFQALTVVGAAGHPAGVVLESGCLDASGIHTVEANGAMTLHAGTTWSSRATGNLGFEIRPGGALRGEGRIDGQILRNFGALSPGVGEGGTGILEFGAGSPAGYDQRSTGSLEVDLGGNDPGSGYDQVRITASRMPVSLSGALRVRILDGFHPGSGDEFLVLVAPDGIVGAFDEVVLPEGFSLVAEPGAIRLIAGASTVPVALDIRPADCPNPLNPSSHGSLPVAILGTEELDVADVDPTSLRLEGAGAVGWSLKDVSSPLGTESCCVGAGPDGVLDLVLKFSVPEIAAGLGPVQKNAEVVLTLEGALRDGTPVFGEDCVVIRGAPEPGRGVGKRSTNGGVVVENGLRLLSGPMDREQRAHYVLLEESRVAAAVYDVAGRLVSPLFAGTQAPGEHALSWTPDSRIAGVYFLRLETEESVMTVRVVLLP